MLLELNDGSLLQGELDFESEQGRERSKLMRGSIR